MHKNIACLSLVALLAAACGGGGIESDMKKSGAELRKDAEKMSVEELEAKIKEIEKYGEAMGKQVGEEPSQADMEKATKLFEMAGIYSTELLKRKMK